MRSFAGKLALLMLLGLATACQSTVSDKPELSAAPVPVVPLAEVASITAAELTGTFVRFPLAGHELAMQLPDGFCVPGERTPAYLQEALARFDVAAIEMKVLALSCAMLEGQAQLGFPIPLVIAGLMRNEGEPLVFGRKVGEDYARMVRILATDNDSKIRGLARELLLQTVVTRIERGGSSVGHLDMRSADNRIRLEVLAEVPVEGIDGNVWYFGDFLIGPVGDRLLGVGVINVDLRPTPPVVSQDSIMLFNGVRQVRN